MNTVIVPRLPSAGTHPGKVKWTRRGEGRCVQWWLNCGGYGPLEMKSTSKSQAC